MLGREFIKDVLAIVIICILIVLALVGWFVIMHCWKSDESEDPLYNKCLRNKYYENTKNWKKYL